MAQDLFQVLSGLQVDDNDIREAEIFSVNYLQPLFPDLDLREGTGLRDTSVRAASTLLALLRKGLTYYFTVNSLNNATDQTPEETVDGLMSNFFLSRKQGSNAVITARLYFTLRKNVTISSSLFFSPDNERFYFPKETRSATASDLVFDVSREQYYLDIDLESETSGSEYNVESGQLLFFSTFDPFFTGGEILLLKERSVARETNVQFVDRASTAISTRNLINAPSIDSRIRETFNSFRNITSVGMGEEEMLRDLITVRTGTPPVFAQVHVGGHVDVYVDSEVEIVEEQLEFQEDEITGEVSAILPETSVGVFDVLRVSGIGDTVPVPVEYKVSLLNYNLQGQPVEPKFDLGLSSRQSVRISLINGDGTPAADYIGETATFRMKKVVGLSSLQSFFDDSLSRVLCADLLARSYEILDLDIRIDTHSTTSVDVFTADQFVRQYVDGILPGDPFVTSELMEILSRDAGIENIVTPMNIAYTLNKKNLEKEVGSITSILSPTRLQRFRVNSVTLNGVVL